MLKSASLYTTGLELLWVPNFLGCNPGALPAGMACYWCSQHCNLQPFKSSAHCHSISTLYCLVCLEQNIL